MSSSKKPKSRSIGNEPLQIKHILAPSASSVHPQILKANEANERVQSRQTKKLRKKTGINEKGPLTSSGVLRNPKNSQPKIGIDKSMPDTVAAFGTENPSLGPLNEKATIKIAEGKKVGKVNELVKRYEKKIANQKGGKKTRKNKKSKKSKTRSKRC